MNTAIYVLVRLDYNYNHGGFTGSAPGI